MKMGPGSKRLLGFPVTLPFIPPGTILRQLKVEFDLEKLHFVQTGNNFVVYQFVIVRCEKMNKFLNLFHAEHFYLWEKLSTRMGLWKLKVLEPTTFNRHIL